MKECHKSDNVKLISQVERGIRKLIGDDAGAGANLMLRKSTSHLALNFVGQTLEEKVKYNIRVSGANSGAEDLDERDEDGVLEVENGGVSDQMAQTRKLIKERARTEMEKRKLQARKLEAKLAREVEEGK